MKDSQIHSGHRERMLKRFTEYPDSLNDHEILEILLYNLIPRVDTNPLAHRLLRVFGSLEKVFNASIKELMTVDGVGYKIAVGLSVISNAYSRSGEQKKKKSLEKWSTHETIVNSLRKIISGYKTEKMVMALLDTNFCKLSHLDFEDRSINSVTMDVPEVISAIAIHKPKYIIVAHNHPSGCAYPSPQDDFTTKKLNLFCDVHGVLLADHVILTDTENFSYFRTNRLDYIKRNYDLNKFLNQKKENIDE